MSHVRKIVKGLENIEGNPFIHHVKDQVRKHRTGIGRIEIASIGDIGEANIPELEDALWEAGSCPISIKIGNSRAWMLLAPVSGPLSAAAHQQGILEKKVRGESAEGSACQMAFKQARLFRDGHLGARIEEARFAFREIEEAVPCS